MVMTRAAAHDVSRLAVDDMTDDQMQDLLSQASERLKAQQVALTSTINDEKARLIFPKLDAGLIAHPYTIAGQAGVVRMADRKPEPRSSQSLYKIRKVEDPVVVHNRIAEVSIFLSVLHLGL